MSVSIPIQRRAMTKNVQSTTQLGSSNMLPRLCSKFFKLGFNSTWTKTSQMYKLGFEEAKEPEIKLPTFAGSWTKQGSFRKTSISASLTTLKLLCESQQTAGNSVKKQQLEPDVEQKTGSKLGKEHNKAVYFHPAYLTYMENTSCKMLGWMNHKLESRLPEEISTTKDMPMIPL